MPDHSRAKTELPPIPAKRYFTIGEVSDLCAVKPHVLRYWEQEFAQLKPVKRRGRIRDLLYEQGFTINGARHRLESDIASPAASSATDGDWMVVRDGESGSLNLEGGSRFGWTDAKAPDLVEIRQELEEIRRLLGHDS
jgi:DNA-binding transcriptional MerR regulator